MGRKAKFRDVVYPGAKIGSLVVESVVLEQTKYGEKWFAYCRQHNGVAKRFDVQNLSRGLTRGIGSPRKELGGLTREHSRTYNSYQHMKQRCCNATHPKFDNYGGRGISVCDRWMESFEAFLDDMGDRPEGTSLERIDGNGNYEPGNCKWATDIEQNNNKRTNSTLTIYGKSMTVAQWARIAVTYPALIHGRKRRGWTDKEAVFGRSLSA